MSDTSSTYAIELRGVTHEFKGRKALADVSFQVRSGSLHGFVGPNGAGKTTALKIICTLLAPQRGEVRVHGLNVARQTTAVRRRIGFMPDHFSMYRQMTVFEYLDFFGAAYGQGLAERNRVIADVLELTDMEARRESLIQQLSRGMQQRVCLARALINDPQLLLLDEPASGLDPRARIELMDILRALQGMGKTVFISSHILSELAELCDSVTIIDRGNICYTGSMDDLLGQTEGARVFLLGLDQPPPDIEQRLAAIPCVSSATTVEGKSVFRVTLGNTESGPNELLKAVVTAEWTVTSFAEERKHLNQAFMDLTQGGVA
jgi:ABC-2 type transport system ATP-binding protein